LKSLRSALDVKQWAGLALRLKRLLPLRRKEEEYIRMGEFPKPKTLEEAAAVYPYLKDYLESLQPRLT